MAIRSSKSTAVSVKNLTPKVAKKATTKKAPAKKAATPKTTQKIKKVPLVVAPEPAQFWLNDGRILPDLVALAESFAAMDDLLYRYHVSTEKNDFADWVESVLCDAECADSLRKATTPKKAHKVVTERLRIYHY
jgi:hypothetical protein